jgi:hypothetical protein
MVHKGGVIQRRNERKWTNFDATSGTVDVTAQVKWMGNSVSEHPVTEVPASSWDTDIELSRGGSQA